MRKWNVVLTVMGVALASTLPETGGAEVRGAAVTQPMVSKTFGGVRGGVRPGTTVHRWGPRFQGRWYAGWYAPGGWGSYRRPVVGYVLPRYWVSPGFVVPNYGAYGLPAPQAGYRWSRYYDDAVMTDRHGRVLDHRGDVDWEGYDTLRDQKDPVQDGWYDDGVTYDHGYEGRWSGTWHDKDGKTFSGDYEGRFEGKVDGGYGVDYDAPPYAAAPYFHREVHDGTVVTTSQGPGYVAGGYYYPAPTVTTVVVQPTVTTTTTYVTKSSSRVRPKNRSRCRC